ncbi:MAG: AAA family ATPase, partial [Chloroflexota bacterium]
SLLDSLEQVKQWVRDLSPALVVIDSVGKALGDDPLDHRRIIRFYTALDGLGTVLCVDHQPKSGGEGGYGAKWEFGSSYKRHLARSSWQLEKITTTANGVGIVMRHKKSNFGPLSKDVFATLVFDDNTVRLEPAADSVGSLAARPTLRSLVLECLESDARTAEQVAEANPDFSLGAVRNELTRLTRDGLARVVGQQGRANIYGRAETHHPHLLLSDGGDEPGEAPERNDPSLEAPPLALAS